MIASQGITIGQFDKGKLLNCNGQAEKTINEFSFCDNCFLCPAASPPFQVLLLNKKLVTQIKVLKSGISHYIGQNL